MKTYFQDLSFSSATAGLVSVLVGYSSSAIIVYQAAISSGATPAEASSWLGILCLAMGLLGIFLSLKSKIPTMYAWSTAGAALLITSAEGLTLPQIMGAFLLSATLITLSGLTGIFEKVMNRIPTALSSAMLAGVLLHFALDVFVAMKTQLLLTFILFLVYLFARRFSARSSIVFVLAAGIMLYWFEGLLIFPEIKGAFLEPHFVKPEWSLKAAISLGLPLFVVTMASQNLTGVTVLQSHGYKISISKLITISGLTNLLIAPFGGFTLNLSALTAAICMGPEAHPDPDKRYTAAVTSGIIYLFIGIFSGVVATFFSAFPKEFVMAIAGLALFTTINSSLTQSLKDDSDREAAIITFFITASGVSLFGIGAAFWGLIGGCLSLIIKNIRTS